MQYNNYNIQVTDSCFIIRDSNGEYVASTPTEEEAIDYISTIDETEVNNKINWIKQFEIYCNKMPYKVFIDGKLASTNAKILEKFIKSFEKSHKVKITTRSAFIGGETFYIVENVEKE